MHHFRQCATVGNAPLSAMPFPRTRTSAPVIVATGRLRLAIHGCSQPLNRSGNDHNLTQSTNSFHDRCLWRKNRAQRGSSTTNSDHGQNTVTQPVPNTTERHKQITKRELGEVPLQAAADIAVSTRSSAPTMSAITTQCSRITSRCANGDRHTTRHRPFVKRSDE
jgi:hypothetical protein